MPSFDKYPPREKDSNSTLPSYMHVYTRFSMNTLNAKLLKDINYSESTFLSPRSTFVTKTQISHSAAMSHTDSFY